MGGRFFWLPVLIPKQGPQGRIWSPAWLSALRVREGLRKCTGSMTLKAYIWVLGLRPFPVGSNLTPLGPLTLYKLLRPLASSAIRAVEVPMLGKGPGCNRLSGLRLPRPLFPKSDSEFYPQKYPKVVRPKTSRPLEYNIYNMHVIHAPPSAPQGILRDHPSLPDP